MAKVQGASLRRSLDGRRKTRKVSRSVARERAIISTTLLSRKRSWVRLCFSICACHPCAKESHNTTADDDQAGKPFPPLERDPHS